MLEQRLQNQQLEILLMWAKDFFVEQMLQRAAFHGVYAIGKFISFNFKTWQAVGIAKNIGNAAMFLGSALAVVSAEMDLHSMHKEREHEKAMADVCRDITSQFKAVAIDLEQQIEGQLREFETQVYGKLDEEIAGARQSAEAAMAASHSELSQLATLRKALEAILTKVYESAKSK